MSRLAEVLRQLESKRRQVESAGKRLDLFPSERAEQALANLYAELALLEAEAQLRLEQMTGFAAAMA